jgi:sulfur carrier protein ThiS
MLKSLIKPFFISLSIQLKIKVKLSRTKESREITLKEGSTVGDVLRKIKLKPDTVIVINNNTPVPVDDVLNNDQILTIIQVSSGG